MATQSTPAAEPQGTFGGDLVGMFNFYIDPQASAKLISHKWFWIGPVIVVSVIWLVTSLQLLPVFQHVMEVTPPPPNATPEQYQRGIEIGVMVQRVVAYLFPIVTIIFTAIFAAILLGSCAVMQVKAKFLWLFNLLAGLGLISVLERIATLAIIKLKSDVNTMAELQPPLGLDIFLPEGTNKYLLGFVGFFSVFQIWFIVMLVLVFAAAFKVSKGKALAVVSPLVIITLLLKLVGAAFQR